MATILFVFMLMIKVVVRGQVGPGPQSQPRGLQYTCKPNQVLGVSKQTDNEIGMQSTHPPICGQLKPCVSYTQGKACVSKGQYVSGVVSENGVITVGCCQYEPVQDHSSDDCHEIFIEVTNNADGPVRPPPRAPLGRHQPTGPSDNSGNQGNPQGLVVVAELRDEPPGNPAQLVKAITPLKQNGVQGYSVTVCTPQCGRSSTPPTPTPKPKSQEKPQSGEKKGPHPKKHFGEGGHKCFSSDMTVTTPYGFKRMDEIRAGDKVLVMQANGKQIFEPIEWLYHRDPNVNAEFVAVTTKSERVLRLSPNHLIPIVPCSGDKLKNLDQLADSSSYFARRLRVGDCIAAVNNNTEFTAEEIVSVARERKKGIYSPITNQGTIIVNDLFVSCFSSVENQLAQRTVHSSLIKVRRVVSAAWNSIFGFALPREDSNIPLPLKMLLKMTEFVLPSNVYSG